MYDRDLLESRRVVNELERVVLWWGVTIAMGNEQIHLGAKLEPPEITGLRDTRQ